MKSLIKAAQRLPLWLFLVFAIPLQTFPCLILKIAHGNAVLAGNNEDVVLKLTAERYPESRSFHHLASAAETAGDIELAIESYKKVLQLEPGNEEAVKSIQELERKRPRK